METNDFIQEKAKEEIEKKLNTYKKALEEQVQILQKTPNLTISNIETNNNDEIIGFTMNVINPITKKPDTIKLSGLEYDSKQELPNLINYTTEYQGKESTAYWPLNEFADKLLNYHLK